MVDSRRDREGDIQREIDGHLDLETEALTASGARSDDARRRARLAFGNPALVHEDVRAVWRWVWLEHLSYDARHALRLWAASPALSIVAALTIALGIGGSTAIVGLIRAVFWTPLAVSQPEQLRQLAWSAPRFPYVIGGKLNVLPGPTVDGATTFGTLSYPAYEALRNESTVFSDLACWAAFGEARPVTLGPLGFANVQFVSGNYFRTLGVGVAHGRAIEPSDDGPGTWSPVAVIGYQYWRRMFGADPNITAQTLQINGRSFPIVGVLPASFGGLDPGAAADVMLPMGAAAIAAQTTSPLRNGGIWAVCRTVGRLKAGISDMQASTETEHILATSIAATPPAEPYDPPKVFLTEGAYGIGTVREASGAPLGVLLVGVGTVLLAACVNIAGLLLARGDARQREIATRLALGAPRSRLVRQLITESLVLSVAGGVVGITLAFAFASRTSELVGRFMPTLFGSDRQLAVSTAPDLGILLVGAVLTIAAGLMFGLSPAMRATNVDLIGTIRRPDSQSGSGAWHSGRVLIAAQAAFAVALLVTSGLFIRTLVNLRAADPGFQVEQLLYARVAPRSANLSPEQRVQFFQEAARRLSQLPGVVSASAGTEVPFGGETNVSASTVLQVCLPPDAPGGRTAVPVRFNSVAPGYFQTLGVSMLSGRDFTWADPFVGRNVPLVISRELARQAFGSDDAAGRALVLTPDCSGPRSEGTVVGVVGDVRSDSREAPSPTIYFPLGGPGVPITLLVRASGDAAGLITSVRRAITEINAEITTFSEAPLATLRERAFRKERAISDLLLLFAVVTTFLTSIGIFGVMSYEVVRRTREIGIRVAIGADAATIMRLVARDSLVVVLGGMAAGLVVALIANRIASSLFYGVTPADPIVLMVSAAAFLAVAAVAAIGPAWSATRIDPARTLRS